MMEAELNALPIGKPFLNSWKPKFFLFRPPDVLIVQMIWAPTGALVRLLLTLTMASGPLKMVVGLVQYA